MHAALAGWPDMESVMASMRPDEKKAAKAHGDAAAEKFRTALAARIVAKRKAKDMTQADLANAAGISLASLGGYESAKREPHMSQAHRLAKALGMTVPELLFGLKPDG